MLLEFYFAYASNIKMSHEHEKAIVGTMYIFYACEVVHFGNDAKARVGKLFSKKNNFASSPLTNLVITRKCIENPESASQHRCQNI